MPNLYRGLHSLILKKNSSWKFKIIPSSLNKYGYFSFIFASLSHVSSSILELLHNTLTNRTFFIP